MNILLTGGLGYIGSHTAVELLADNNNVCIFDNLSNSDFSVIERIQKISGKKVSFVEGDLKDQCLLQSTLIERKIEAVIHFAGSKSVNESVLMPIDYYDNNVVGTLSLLKAMQSSDVKTLIFSSSASVYGAAKYNPINEEHSLQPVSPYARTKKHIEEIMFDLSASDDEWKFIFLRYFNPVGAHESGLIGESPVGVPNNLMPYISQVAFGSLPYLSVYGDDYPTKDGTGVRDYIHVVDLAEGHLAALNYLVAQKKFKSPSIFNLGTGRGVSVLELVTAFEEVIGSKIPNKITARRLGDVACCYADNSKAKKILCWSAKKSLRDICETTWRFQKNYAEVIGIDRDCE
jgi:UDP-glucose 4-epimerase